MIIKDFLYSLIFTLSLTLTVFSQNAEKPKENLNVCNQDTALQLVENQVIKANQKTESLKLIKILVRAGEFAWELNEEKSRGYYSKALEFAKKRYKEKGFEKKKKSGIFIQKPNYRLLVIRSIAKKDSKWARELTKEILDEYKKDFENRESRDKLNELRTITNMAVENVKNNPEFSKQLFNEIMKYQLDSHWHWGLAEVANINQSFADDLYRKLLVNYRLEAPKNLLFLSAYPFNRFRIMGYNKMQYASRTITSFTPDISLQIAFADTFFYRINQLASNPEANNQSTQTNGLDESVYMVSGLTDLESYVRQNFPQKLEALGIAKAKAKAEAMLSAKNRKRVESRHAFYDKPEPTIDERIKKLEESDSKGELKDSQIVSVIISLSKEEEFKKAERWIDKIKVRKAREDTTDVFYHKRSNVALKAKNYENAKKYADKVPAIEFRALLYFDIAKAQSKNYNDSAEVRDNLLEVSTLARKTKDSVGKAQVLLGLAYIYEEIEHFDALNEISAAVKVINKLENPDLFSSSIGQQILTARLSYFVGYSTPGYNMETAFERISKNDFDLTLAHAQSLSDSYFQTIAVLAVAKNCVENSKKEVKENAKNELDAAN